MLKTLPEPEPGILESYSGSYISHTENRSRNVHCRIRVEPRTRGIGFVHIKHYRTAAQELVY